MCPEKNPVAPQGQKPYKVLKIDELVRLADTGGIEKYYRHTIKTRGGTVLSIDIDARDFIAERVDVVLTARATEADKILGL